MKIPRTPLTGTPDVVILADEQQVKQDPDYPHAKAGDALAADRLTERFVDALYGGFTIAPGGVLTQS